MSYQLTAISYQQSENPRDASLTEEKRPDGLALLIAVSC